MKQQPDYLIPINFSLTKRAIEKIQAVNQQCREEKGIDPVPAICWLLQGTDHDGRSQTFNSPHIGIYDRRDLPEDAIQSLGGIEVVFSVAPDVAQNFDNQLIDYADDRDFYFVKKPKSELP
jgi:hypothetical protein